MKFEIDYLQFIEIGGYKTVSSVTFWHKFKLCWLGTKNMRLNKNLNWIIKIMYVLCMHFIRKYDMLIFFKFFMVFIFEKMSFKNRIICGSHSSSAIHKKNKIVVLDYRYSEIFLYMMSRRRSKIILNVMSHMCWILC